MQLQPVNSLVHVSPRVAPDDGDASSPAAAAAPAAAPAAGTLPGSVCLANWNNSHTTRPAAVVMARDIAHVQEVVRDSATYPTPVTVVGSMHSINECIVNDGGTLLVTSGMDGILGLVGGGEQRLVTVQAGCKLAKLHSWLAQKDSELSFCPEIGDATVGSLVTCTSKDSSLGALGYLADLVYDVTYVDEEGEVVRLRRDTDAKALAHFTCSNGLMGIVVEATLVARPLAAIRTHLHCLLVNDKMPQRLLRLREKADNLFAIISTDGCVYVEQRFARPGPASSKPGCGSGWITRLLAGIKYSSFLKARLHKALGCSLVLLGPVMKLLPLVHYRNAFVNSYPAVSASQQRLDFSFYEFPLERFSEVVPGMLGQIKAFAKETGFKPNGLGVYFAERPGDRPAGNFCGPPGTSFTVDPFYNNPTNPLWLKFLDRINDWAAANGGRMSLTQTKRITGRHYLLEQRYVRTRFLSAYYKQFVK